MSVMTESRDANNPSLSGDVGASRGAYGFLVFMMALNILNILDRQLLPTFGNEIKADLGLSNSQFGLLTGIMFTLLYGLFSPFMGLLADVVHRPRFAAMGVGLWSLLTAASGLARNFAGLAVPRILIGVGESTLTPTALSMLSDRFPARQLGFVSGFYYSGVPLGSALAFFIAAALGPVIGWRNCFLLIGAIGLALALWLATMPETRPASSGGGRGVLRSMRAMAALLPDVLRALRRSPALLLTILGGIGVHLAVGAAQFDTIWWKEELGLETGPLFLKVALIYATVGVAGNILGGLLSDWWLRATGQGRSMLTVVLLVAFAPIQFLYRLTDDDGWIFWLGIGTAIFQLAVMYGGALSTIQELAPVRVRATAVAVFILCINVLGIGLATTAGGFMVDAFAAAGRERPITDMMLVMTTVSLLSIPAFYVASLRFSADREALRLQELADGR
jgi:MFS family permease